MFDSLYARGEYDVLISYLKKQESKNPKDEHVLRGLGYVYIGKNNLELGEKYYTEALKINPNCGKCYINIGRIYSIRKDNPRALTYFDKAVEVEPANAVLYSHRARMKELLGEDFRAMLDHNKAIALAPDVAEFYFFRGINNKKQKYFAAAIVDFTKAIELDSTVADFYYERTAVFYEQRKHQEAFDDITRAIQLDSGQYRLYVGRGAIFEVQKKYEEAIQDYSKAIRLNSDDYLAFLNRANSLYELERVDEACSDYLTTYQIIQKSELKDKSVIKEVTASITDLCDSSRSSYYYQRGIAFYNLKEFNKALTMYARGLSKFPDNAMMLSFQGNAYLALDQFEKAIESFTSSLKYKENILQDVKLNPRFINAGTREVTDYYQGTIASNYFSIAECQLYLGLYDQSMENINTGFKEAPEIPSFTKEAFYNLKGRVFLAQNRNEQAVNEFNKSLGLDRRYAPAYLNRAIAEVNLATNSKKSIQFNGQYRHNTMQTDWIPLKKRSKTADALLASALDDCNTAIEIDQESAAAYFIRGQVKRILVMSDFCVDLLKAKTLGMTIDSYLLEECK